MNFLRTISATVLVCGYGFWLGMVKAPSAQPGPQNSNAAKPAIIFVEAPVVLPGDLRGRFPQGSHLARFSPGAPANSAVNLTPNLFAAADPQVSFDAARVLFAGQKNRGSRWQIWEMSADGADQRQITHCELDCLRPVYLPRNQIAFTMAEPMGAQSGSTIYVSNEDGTDVHPITFGPGDFQVETVLRNGRLLVSAGSLLSPGARQNDSRVFYTLRTDGSGLSEFRWDDRPDMVRTGAEELDDGSVLFIERHDPGGRESGGALALARPGALHNAVISPAGVIVWSAHELDGNKLMVARQGREGRYGLYAFDLASQSFGKAIYENAKYSSVDAVPIEPRSVPLYYRSILHPDWNYGRVICLNAYLSAGAPQGRIAGRIARVRVLALGLNRRQRVLGTAPVESDGSFYVKLPADFPVRFELLNGQGATIRAQRSWIWARTGEDVGCVGCHEDRALAPQDHWPLALKRFDTPIPVGLGAASKATQR